MGTITLMQLDLNLLTALDALLDESSVSGAAQRLHLSEPAMSRTLGRIRRATGDPILIRAGRSMTPTPRAVAMHDEVRLIVLRSSALLAPVTELDLGSLERTFTLRCHDAIAAPLAAVLVHRTSESAPLVAFRFVAEVPADTADLGRGLVDLAIGSATFGPADIVHEHVADDQLVGLARYGNPHVAGRAGLDGFVSAPHVIVSRRGRLVDATDDVLQSLGRSRRVVASVASTAAALEIVRDTDAIATVPSSIASRASADGSLLSFPLPVHLPPVPIVLAWQHRLTPDVGHAWLRGLVRDALSSMLTDSSV